MKTTIKEVFESDKWIITSVLQGSNYKVRINGKTKFHRSGGVNFFSKWCSEKYANMLARKNYGNSLHNFKNYR